MLEQFDQYIYEFGNLNQNDGYDEELDLLAEHINALLLCMSEEEIKELLKRPYMSMYKELIKSILIRLGRWEEEVYGN
ncbi:MAG: hypothetical protein IJ193_09240 [Bacilli bacterium]|nr:hypothetical protein [Bacilli bacterium]